MFYILSLSLFRIIVIVTESCHLFRDCRMGGPTFFELLIFSLIYCKNTIIYIIYMYTKTLYSMNLLRHAGPTCLELDMKSFFEC